MSCFFILLVSPSSFILSSLRRSANDFEWVSSDQVFLTLYRELYFRHVYAKLEPNVDDRFQSYENICELFNLLLSESCFDT